MDRLDWLVHNINIHGLLLSSSSDGLFAACSSNHSAICSPYYYTLDRLGVRYLQQAGMDISESFRAGKEVDKHALFIQHTLEVNDIIIAAAMLKRSSNYWLGSFIHERELKRQPYKAT